MAEKNQSLRKFGVVLASPYINNTSPLNKSKGHFAIWSILFS